MRYAFSKSLISHIYSLMTSKYLEKGLLTKGFENDKNQIGFCGIWCGSCLGDKGAILELTRKYEQIIKHSQSALEKWAPKEFNFNEFMKGLAYIQAMLLCPGCKKDDRNPTCEIRICALNKNLTNCSQCDDLAECKNFESLEKDHPKIKEELRISIRKK
jgi:hypothetical protein